MTLHNGDVTASINVEGAIPHVVPETCSDSSGIWSFYSPDNWEVLLKVLDGCSVNGHWWVFVSAATDREWLVEVSAGSITETYRGADGTVTDTEAFPCKAAGP